MSSPGPVVRVRAWSDPAQPAALNHKVRPHGSCRYPSRSAGCVRAGSACRHLREATDLSVTQAPVDEAEHPAGGGDAPDVATPALGDAPVVGLDPVAAVVAADGLDGG